MNVLLALGRWLHCTALQPPTQESSSTEAPHKDGPPTVSHLLWYTHSPAADAEASRALYRLNKIRFCLFPLISWYFARAIHLTRN